MKRVSLIIPTYNEAKNLPILLQEIFSAVDSTKVAVEIIIVDDNSPDGTGEVAEKLKATYPVHVIHRSGKLGLGSAVRAGFSHSTSDYLAVMDADLSHDPHLLNTLVAALDSHDIAVGSRFMPESSIEQWAWWRKCISHTGVWVTKRLTGVRDPLSGFFALRRSVIDHTLLDTVGYKILFEILVKGQYKQVVEFPYQFRIRQHSSSKLNTKEYVLFVSQILRYTWHKIRNT